MWRVRKAAYRGNIGMEDRKEKLIRCAEDEFAEKGYSKASLRTICKNADMTTGALYFFFKDKDDLFSAVVGDALKELTYIIQTHYQLENTKDELVDDGEDDVRATREIIAVLYRHRREFDILLNKAQGSSLENIAEKITLITRDHHVALVDRLSRGRWNRENAGVLIDWMSHALIDAFVFAFKSYDKEEEAGKFVLTVTSFIRNGWVATFS